MGTKVQSESYFPGYYSMRNLNEDSNGDSWSVFYGDKTLTNGQYYNGFFPRAAAAADGYSEYEKDVVKKKILEHEAIFKNQVYELHRLYRIQRDLMDDIRRKELHRRHIPAEASLSSAPLASQLPSNGAHKWHFSSFPMVNSMGGRPSFSSAEDIHSHLSCIKGKSAQAGPVPSQNGDSSKDCEILESRPTKVRRKMFDLQLPADEYIDTEEVNQLEDEMVSEISSYPANGACKTVAASGVKLFVGSSEKSCCQGDASRSSNACVGSRNGLADLNEPFQVEDTNASASLDMLGNAACHEEIQGQILKPQFLGLPNETLQQFHRGRDQETLKKVQVENRGNGRDWISYMLEAGHSQSNLTSGSHGFQQEKLPIPSQPLQALLNKVHEPPAFLLTDQSKGEPWRERTISGVKFSERSRDISNYNNPVMTPNFPSPYQFAPSSDLVKSWSHAVSSWEKPISVSSQQSVTVQAYPCFNMPATMNSSQSSAQSPGIFGEKGHINGECRSNSGFGSEVPNRNRFYHGSSSGSKEQPIHFLSTGSDYLNSSNNSSVAFEHVSLGSTKYFNATNHMDVNSAKDIKFDMMLLNSSSIRAVPQQGVETIGGERKHEDHLEVLPWLRAKTACKNEATYARKDMDITEFSFSQNSSNKLVNKVDTAKVPSKSFAQIITSASCAHDVGSKEVNIGDCPSPKMILGFPIFEKHHVNSKNDSACMKSLSASVCPSKGEDISNKKKVGVFDMNVPFDPAVSDSGKDMAAEVMEKRADREVASLRNYIDLNLCISEDEAPLRPSIPSSDAKTSREIDLEAPISKEFVEDIHSGEESHVKQYKTDLQLPQQKVVCVQDELVTIAAEAIVAISSSDFCDQLGNDTCNPLEESSMDPLHWFVEVISSCADNLESNSVSGLRGKDRRDDKEESSSDGIDYFECMTLNLTENTEDYVSTLPVIENPKVEETGTNLLTNRTRKGQARRGRQRRDFQRDILPGLVSLSRHEVTEDLQTFGGLMRATGHPWHSVSTRRTAAARNGFGRGRRRSVAIAAAEATAVEATPVCSPLIQQINNIEVGLEDRSLTGWGKTTRRPRRQRCPAGNPPSSLPLT